MLEAVEAVGLPVLADLNGEREESIRGFALMNHIIKAGRRQNMPLCYLYPAMARPNLTVLTQTHVERLLMQGTTAQGVELSRAGQRSSIRASREVIVCQGAINSPKLLMLSGIGDPAQLKAAGIGSRVAAADVGRNFQDHILHGGCIWALPEPLAPRNSAAEASGFWKSDASLATPDLNLVQIELPYASEVVAKQYQPPAAAWALCAGLVAPKSRGQVRLRSANPDDRPIVDANFLGDPADVKALRRGIELCREIGNAAPLSRHVTREVAPGRALAGDALDAFIRDGTTAFFHQVGTCRMGADDGAVVDASLKVKGVDRLRVADGSIMPTIVSCATMASCVLIGERMAEILTGKRL